MAPRRGRGGGRGAQTGYLGPPQGRLLVVEHDGGGDGMRAEFQIYPQADMAVAVLVNSGTRQFQAIRRMILDELKPGYSGYLDALYEIPLESDQADKQDAPTRIMNGETRPTSCCLISP